MHTCGRLAPHGPGSRCRGRGDGRLGRLVPRDAGRGATGTEVDTHRRWREGRVSELSGIGG